MEIPGARQAAVIQPDMESVGKVEHTESKVVKIQKQNTGGEIQTKLSYKSQWDEYKLKSRFEN